jgi:hypothetical protein
MGAPASFSRFAQATLPMMLLNTCADIASGYQWEGTRPGAYGGDLILREEDVLCILE